MKLQNVLLAVKESSLKYYKRKCDDLYEKLNSNEILRMVEEQKEHDESVRLLKETLEKYSISSTKVFTPYFSFNDFQNRDLIIALGGDGTILKSSRYIRDNTPILNVKGEKDSFGALCTIDVSDFKESLEKILSDKYFIEKWTRIEGEIDGKKDIALNEIYIGPQFFNNMARYNIAHNGMSESQKSGKLIISTGTGSTGWYNNASNDRTPFPKTSEELRYIVSESIKTNDYKMLSGSIFLGEELKILSKMDGDGVVSYDCINLPDKGMYDFSIRKMLTVRISDKPLHVIVPNKD